MGPTSIQKSRGNAQGKQDYIFWVSKIIKFRVSKIIKFRVSKIIRNPGKQDCPGACFGSRNVATGSPEGHLKRNFEISPLGHLPEPKTGLKNLKIQKIRKFQGSVLLWDLGRQFFV